MANNDNADHETAEETVAREPAERPAGMVQRRVKWTVRELEVIGELAENEANALRKMQMEDGEDYSAELSTLDLISAKAELLANARTDHGPADTPRSGEWCAQVAYLAPIEVVVDLDAGTVLRVVVIDEAIELDTEEAVRAAATLAPLRPDLAEKAIAIAELEPDTPAAQQGWPRFEYGW